MKEEKNQVCFSKIVDGHLFRDSDGAHYLKLPPEMKYFHHPVNAVMLLTSYAHQFAPNDLVFKENFEIADSTEAAPVKEES